MKFIQVAIVLVALFASISSVDAAFKKKNRRQLKTVLDHRAKNGLVDTQTLMRGAKPYSEAAKKRKLGNDYEITGAFSVQFQTCFSMTTSYEDLFENQDDFTTMQLMQNGNLLPMRSFAIFRLCYNGVCGENGQSGFFDYVVDLDTYVQALVNYLPEQMEGFCEGCMENQEACLTILYGGYAGAYQNAQQNYWQYQNYNANANNYNGANVNNVNYGYNNYNNGQQQQQAYYQNGYGNRKLLELHEFEYRVLQDGQVVKQLDCNLCQEYGCLSDDDNQNDRYGFEAASEWLQDIAECRETGASYNYGYNGYYNQNGGNDNQLFAGFVCNEDGSGVELGLFLDEECILFLPNEPYTNYMNYFDQTYAQMTKEIIEFTFSNVVLSCKNEEVVYTTQNVGQYGQMQNYNWNGNNDAEISEWCGQLVEGGESGAPVDINSCNELGQYSNEYDYGNQNQQYERYWEEYQQQQNFDEYQMQYQWYRFEIDLEDTYDMYYVCKKMKSSDGLHTFYNSSIGHMYDYHSTANSASDTIEEFLEGSDSDVDYLESSTLSFYNRAQSLSAVEKFGIVAGTGVLVGATVALFMRFRSMKEEDSKEESLIDKEEDVVEQSRKGEIA